MTKKEVEIRLENGLEARPVALLVQTASQFDSAIYIESGNAKVNAKSIMGMMTLVLHYEKVLLYEKSCHRPRCGIGNACYCSGRERRYPTEILYHLFIC